MALPFLLFFVVVCGSVLPAGAEDVWPSWRGLRGDGSSPDKVVPLKWSVEKNTVWKTPLPGKGHASPIVWKDDVFIVTAVEDKRQLLCLDRRSGKVKWSEAVLTSPQERIHRRNSLASSTPATDGEQVYVSFLDGQDMCVAAYSLTGRK